MEKYGTWPMYSMFFDYAAREGVVITDPSLYDPIVILRHFANDHPGTPQ